MDLYLDYIFFYSIKYSDNTTRRNYVLKLDNLIYNEGTKGTIGLAQAKDAVLGPNHMLKSL